LKKLPGEARAPCGPPAKSAPDFRCILQTCILDVYYKLVFSGADPEGPLPGGTTSRNPPPKKTLDRMQLFGAFII